MASALAPGTLLDGKYEILSRLGAGGMGEVFKAKHIHLNAFRCIKVLREGLITDDASRTRFLREAQLATQIHHPNIAVVHDFFLGDRGSYMVTEFIDGTTVRQWSAAHGRFPLALAADVAAQVLGGLDHIHRRGLLHRDVSSDNIMLSYDTDDAFNAKIIDLGIAKDINSNAGPADTTQTGMLIGNPKYMSPEQLGDLAPGEQVDRRADLYCLGVVLFEMLLGVPPFTSETPHGYIVKHLTQQVPSFASLKPELDWPDGLESVIRKALMKNRRERYADAREFAAAMQPFLSAPAGMLTRDDVARLLRGPEKTVVDQPLPRGSDMPTEVVSDVKSDDEAFQRAWEDGTPDAWRTFLATCPASKHVESARELLREAIAFDAASAETSSDTGLREFLKAWPEGRHHFEAEIRLVEVKQKIAEAAFAQACATDTYAAMRDFLGRFPGTPHAEEAQRRLSERLEFETAAAADSENAWDDYLERWGGDAHADEARRRCEALKAREEEAWQRATEAKSADAWEDFLSRFPDSRRSARAERYRREAIAFDVAKASGRAALEDFLRVHADGLLARQARKLARQLGEAEDYRQARALDTLAAWRLYLTAHATGPHADEARARVAEIEDETFAAVMASKSAERGGQFLQDFPHSPRREQVAKLVAAWAEVGASQQALEAIARGDADMAASLLAKIADPELRGEVQTALDALRDKQSWEAVSANPTAPALRAYLAARPTGQWASDARRRLARIEEALRESEPHDFDAAFEAGTAAAWDIYLAKYEDSPRITEARQCRQEAADFELACTINTANIWRAFLNTWREGRHRLDAELRLRAKK
jgi:tRNA A-37 threonylcarbamoyl transferase component Bud32